jgi:HEAT repeat protein
VWRLLGFLALWCLPSRFYRLWLRRNWDPPFADITSYVGLRLDTSYVGFLLDTAHDDAPFAATRYLARLASARVGLQGCKFIARQAELGTLIPQDVIRAAADLVYDLAPDNLDRAEAAQVLAGLSDSRAADLAADLALDPTLSSLDRVSAAQELAGLGAPCIAELWHALALDPTLYGLDRVWAAQELARLGDPRAAELAHGLVRDPTLDDQYRVWAAQELAATLRTAELGSGNIGAERNWV